MVDSDHVSMGTEKWAIAEPMDRTWMTNSLRFPVLESKIVRSLWANDQEDSPLEQRSEMVEGSRAIAFKFQKQNFLKSEFTSKG
jgi:K+-transporting ATPase c subunit